VKERSLYPFPSLIEGFRGGRRQAKLVKRGRERV